MRRGILGGTFDPVHYGHLDVADAALRALALSDIRLIPSLVPPHRHAPHAAAAHRFAMASLAVQDRSGMSVSDLDLAGPGPSYTSGLLDRLASQGTDLREIYFVTGADAFRDIETWKDYPAILDRCHFVAVSRPGCPARSLPAALPRLASRMTPASTEDAGPGAAAIHLVDAPTAPVSSTEVRRRIQLGFPVTGLVPPAVAAYIETHSLYRSSPTGSA
jgi:nicotinate-nucleotide adenylyltransferase